MGWRDTGLRCETCPFWERVKEECFGECRLDPPIILSRQKPGLQAGVYCYWGVWPIAHQYSWCGKHPQFERTRYLKEHEGAGIRADPK